jgi:hypothetical protein
MSSVDISYCGKHYALLLIVQVEVLCYFTTVRGAKNLKQVNARNEI